jgi:PDZ domain-containing protein
MSRKALAVFPLAALVVAMWTVKLPYFSQGPGPAKDVEPLIQITGHEKFGSGGHFILTSVSFRTLSVLQAIGAWLDPHRSIVSESAFVYPGESEQQANQRAVSEMDQSKIDATVAVLSRVVGYPKAHGRGVLVEAVGSDCPAAGRLFPGDRLDKVEGHAILSSQDFKRRLDRIPSKAPVHLQGSAGGRSFSVSFVRRPCSGSKKPLIGISSIPTFPFRVSIESGDIGGPSAGLMWALGLYDLLTPGDLSGGRTIAGTGVISATGSVGPIGGVQDKIVAAEAAGAKTFLVPVGNLAEARDAGSDLKLVPVRSLGQALAYLRG